MKAHNPLLYLMHICLRSTAPNFQVEMNYFIAGGRFFSCALDIKWFGHYKISPFVMRNAALGTQLE